VEFAVAFEQQIDLVTGGTFVIIQPVGCQETQLAALLQFGDYEIFDLLTLGDVDVQAVQDAGIGEVGLGRV
jgi:hypothetical protein